jgi:hypothetical protein
VSVWLTYGCAMGRRDSTEAALAGMSPADAADTLLARAGAAWTRRLAGELDRRLHREPLGRFVEIWGLSNASAARLFGVSRQAFAKWLAQGPPADRMPAVADLAAATDLLDRYVKRERVPAVVRRQAPALGGRSLLDLAAAGRTAELLDAVRAMFDLRRVQP